MPASHFYSPSTSARQQEAARAIRAAERRTRGRPAARAALRTARRYYAEGAYGRAMEAARLYGDARRAMRFSLSRNIQPPEEFKKNIRAMSREARKTAWRPKYRVGHYVLTGHGEHGRIASVSPGIPNGYVVVMDRSRYHARGTRVFVPESMIRGHRKNAPAHGDVRRSRRASRGGAVVVRRVVVVAVGEAVVAADRKRRRRA